MKYASYDKLVDMLLYTFKQIELSTTPEHNMEWFVSDEAKEWYADYCKKNNIAEEENKFDSVYNPKV